MSEKLSKKQLISQGLSNIEANQFFEKIQQWQQQLNAKTCWQHISKELLTPQHPFALHQFLYQIIYTDDKSNYCHPSWIPDPTASAATHIGRLMRSLNLKSIAELKDWCCENKIEFWQKVLDQLQFNFDQKPRAIISEPISVTAPEWLPGARYNIVAQCFNATKNKTAIISQHQGVLTHHSYAELEQLTNRVANSFQALGLQAGDVVAVALPLSVAAVAAYLGVIKAGGIIAAIAESYTADEMQTRLEIVNAKFMLTQDHLLRNGKLLPLYQKVCEAQAPKTIVLASQINFDIELRSGDLSWEKFLVDDDRFTAHSCHPNAPCNILFSSGTTGAPKAIPWTHVTPVKCASDALWHLDVQTNDILAWPTSLGWMMGPWLIFAGLLNRATLAIYDDAPTDRRFGEFIQAAEVTILGLVPSIVKHWRTTQCMQGLDWSKLKAFASTGEASNPEDMFYLMMLAGYKPVIEYCGGTEIGGAYITSTLVQDNIPATFSTPSLGLDLVLLNDTGEISDDGEVALIGPSIGLSNTLLNRDHETAYFKDIPTINGYPQLRRHGDHMQRLANGYYKALGRVDDTMKLSGIKVSSAEIEQCLMHIDGIQECAAIAVSPQSGGPGELIIYVVTLPGVKLNSSDLLNAMQTQIKTKLNPLFKIHAVEFIAALPRTASNKVMRRSLRDDYLSR